MRATWTAAALTAALALTPVASAAAAVPRPGSDAPQPVAAPALPMDPPASALPTGPVTDPAPLGKTQTPLAPQLAAPADDGGAGGLVSIVTGLVKTLQNVLSGLLGGLSSAKPPAAQSALTEQATTTQLVPAATLVELRKTVDALQAAENAARSAH
ncbi:MULTISPECIES: hypothetical protein [unclassified Streptomyces]|uniref:hypothetical protein n=1 Tax=unclassified Streptomyces TaxID=2593676 RepID=UPI0034070D9A